MQIVCTLVNVQFCELTGMKAARQRKRVAHLQSTAVLPRATKGGGAANVCRRSISHLLSQLGVQQLFGVGRYLGLGENVFVSGFEMGWLQLLNDHTTERSLERFLRQHPEEYQFEPG